MGRPRPHAVRRRGFTLVELIVVVVVLGVLAAVATPKFLGVAEDARQTAFTRQLLDFVGGIERFHAEHGRWPGDGSTGTLDSDLEDYISKVCFESETPLGGEWDNETDDTGSIAEAVGVHFNNGDQPIPADLAAVDAMIDDGDLDTGAFREIGTHRYYYVIAE